MNKKVSITGLGTFLLQESPATIDFVKGLLRAPQSKIFFIKSEEMTQDQSLFNYLSKEMNLEQWQVARKFLDFSDSIRQSIQDSKSVELPGIGKLQKGEENDIFFIADGEATAVPTSDIKLSNTNDSRSNLVELYTTGENLILTEETEEDKLEMIVRQKDEDYWWVYALILALMGVGALLYYSTN